MDTKYQDIIVYKGCRGSRADTIIFARREVELIELTKHDTYIFVHYKSKDSRCILEECYIRIPIEPFIRIEIS